MLGMALSHNILQVSNEGWRSQQGLGELKWREEPAKAKKWGWGLVLPVTKAAFRLYFHIMEKIL